MKRAPWLIALVNNETSTSKSRKCSVAHNNQISRGNTHRTFLVQDRRSNWLLRDSWTKRRLLKYIKSWSLGSRLLWCSVSLSLSKRIKKFEENYPTYYHTNQTDHPESNWDNKTTNTSEFFCRWLQSPTPTTSRSRFRKHRLALPLGFSVPSSIPASGPSTSCFISLKISR